MSDSQNDVLIKSGAIAGVSLILGLLFDYLLYGKVPGIGFPIYVLFIVAGAFMLARLFKRPVRRDAVWLLVPVAFFSGMVFVRSSVLLTMLNLGATFLLLVLGAGVSVQKGLRDFSVGDYMRIVFLPLMFVVPMFNTLFDLFSMPGVKKDKQVLWQVAKGIMMTVPILIIMVLLLSSADLVFHKYVSDLVNLNIQPETIVRMFLVIAATLAFIGAYTYALKTKEQPAAESEKQQTASIGQIESAILLGSLSALFFIFILVQMTYLFGGQANISAQGFTYAEYARRGFFELIAVAVITLLLLLATEKYVIRQESGHRAGYKALSTFLVIEVAIIMASAFTRLSLYEKAYGFTTLRLYSHSFIIFLAAVFVSFLCKVYIDRQKNMFALRLFITLILYVAAMNAINPDAFIARKNIERFHETKRLDIRYLSSLSDDAVPYTVTLLDESAPRDRKQLADSLNQRRKDLAGLRSFNRWQSINLARIKAEQTLR